MEFAKKLGLTVLAFVTGSLLLGVSKELAAEKGIILGAIPTLLILLPTIWAIQRIWSKRISSKKRKELISRLNAVVDDPNASAESKDAAIDRIALLEAGSGRKT